MKDKPEIPRCRLCGLVIRGSDHVVEVERVLTGCRTRCSRDRSERPRTRRLVRCRLEWLRALSGGRLRHRDRRDEGRCEAGSLWFWARSRRGIEGRAFGSRLAGSRMPGGRRQQRSSRVRHTTTGQDLPVRCSRRLPAPRKGSPGEANTVRAMMKRSLAGTAAGVALSPALTVCRPGVPTPI